MARRILTALVGAAVMGIGTQAASGATLDDVKAKGFVQCGVNTGLAGFAAPDASGNWSGFDVDYCKAIAAAIFADGSKVKCKFSCCATTRF